MMHIYRLERKQKIDSDIDTLWAFFSSPANLAVITPPDMNFKVTSPVSDDSIYAGQIITYTITPLLGIRLSWTTEITQVNDKVSFVDEQRKGPYKLWRHEHRFEQQENGILMTDIVDYALPFSLLGRMAHPIFIKKKLDEIFDFRYQQVELHFNRK
jgi:ligand-binding SRPBCC domain-containing protein